MTAALTPSLALDFVTALSADITAAVVLDSDGEPLAGRAALAHHARALLATAPQATQFEGHVKDGAVYAARDSQHTIVVVTGRFALGRLTRHDLRTALSALGGETRPDEAPATVSDAAVRALIDTLG